MPTDLLDWHIVAEFFFPQLIDTYTYTYTHTLIVMLILWRSQFGNKKELCFVSFSRISTRRYMVYYMQMYKHRCPYLYKNYRRLHWSDLVKDLMH